MIPYDPMATLEKLINGSNVSYKEAETLLFKMRFQLEIRGSHHIFRKKGYHRNISLKKRSQLFPYQIRDKGGTFRS